MIVKKLDEAYHWKPPLVPLTGSEFKWNNWAIHESEVESDDEGPSVKSVEDSDALLSPLASDSEGTDLEIEINKSVNEESSQRVDDSSDLPLIIDITSDGANILQGKKNGVHKKIKDVANQLMLSFHCISYRFQLSVKSSIEKNNKSLKDLFQFIQKLFKYRHNSAVVTAVFHETVKVLGITGATSVIRVNRTCWISHVQSFKKPA